MTEVLEEKFQHFDKALDAFTCKLRMSYTNILQEIAYRLNQSGQVDLVQQVGELMALSAGSCINDSDDLNKMGRVVELLSGPEAQRVGINRNTLNALRETSESATRVGSLKKKLTEMNAAYTGAFSKFSSANQDPQAQEKLKAPLKLYMIEQMLEGIAPEYMCDHSTDPAKPAHAILTGKTDTRRNLCSAIAQLNGGKTNVAQVQVAQLTEDFMKSVRELAGASNCPDIY